VEPVVDAGPLSPWLDEMRDAIAGTRDADVPCGTCTGCCTSSQFIHIGPDEADALAHIPRELLFPAPRAPKGHLLMGYDERGHCPMLVDGACTIYAHRPRTCRTYDCRVFAAAGLDAADDDKPAIAERSRRWQFRMDDPDDATRRDAVRAAVTFLRDRGTELPAEAVPRTATHLAATAVAIHRTFLRGEAGGLVIVQPEPSEVAVELSRRPGR
jgi:uncharacterized protein